MSRKSGFMQSIYKSDDALALQYCILLTEISNFLDEKGYTKQSAALNEVIVILDEIWVGGNVEAKERVR